MIQKNYPKVNKKFDIGKNCFINDYYLVNKVKNYINKNKIKNYVFLFSASSLSNVLILNYLNLIKHIYRHRCTLIHTITFNIYLNLGLICQNIGKDNLQCI